MKTLAEIKKSNQEAIVNFNNTASELEELINKVRSECDAFDKVIDIQNCKGKC
jgi:hypothetical protein